MPKINQILLKLEGFQYATSLDLNMGYYHIWLSGKKVTYVQLLSRGENTGTIGGGVYKNVVLFLSRPNLVMLILGQMEI